MLHLEDIFLFRQCQYTVLVHILLANGEAAYGNLQHFIVPISKQLYHFNSFFPLVFFLQIFLNKTFGGDTGFLNGKMPFLSPSQQYQSTKGNTQRTDPNQ